MTVENESSNEMPAGEGEATSLVRHDRAAAVASPAEEKKLRIVMQVEVKAEIGDGKSTDVNKISVVSEHIRAVIRVIGGGD
jgi:triosephosphate isomerase